MTYSDFLLIILILAAVILGGLYLFNRWVAKKYGSQVAAIDKIKVNTNIFVIDKKKMRLKDARESIPKVIYDSMPKFYRLIKLPLVKAKIGNKILTLVCEEKIFKSINTKKSYKVELAGIYIAGFVKSNKK